MLEFGVGQPRTQPTGGYRSVLEPGFPNLKGKTMKLFLHRRIGHAALVGCLVIGVGCASNPSLPKTFLSPANRLTAEEGQRLIDEGRRIVDDAEAEISAGKRMVSHGRGKRKEGEAQMSRGRTALKAAAMAEEAIRLERKAGELRNEALE